MQYKVDQTCQTRENGHKPDGSFNTAYASHEKNSQNTTRSFPDMRFSQGVHRDSVISYQTIKYASSIDRFPSKSTKSQKMVILTTRKKLLND